MTFIWHKNKCDDWEINMIFPEQLILKWTSKSYVMGVSFVHFIKLKPIRDGVSEALSHIAMTFRMVDLLALA